MAIESSPTTNPELLRRLADWSDVAAWLDFMRRYEGLIFDWCRVGGLGAEAAEEVRQRVYARLAVLMRDARYDASRSFRRWLFVIVRRKVLEYLRECGRNPLAALPDEPACPDVDPDDVGSHPLLEWARGVQEHVQATVNAKAWEVFWRTDIEGEPLGEVAESLGMSYHAAFMARGRVRLRLAKEGRRRRMGPDPGSDGEGASS